jgi:hypothetical protein
MLCVATAMRTGRKNILQAGNGNGD